MRNILTKISVVIMGLLLLGITAEVSEGDVREFTEWDVSHLQPVFIDKTDSLGLHIYYLHRQGFQEEVKPLTNGSTLRSGDLYGIIFTPKEKGYVYIFQVDSSERIEQLFPINDAKERSQNTSNPVQRGNTYYVPAEENPFEVVPQAGIKTIYVLSSRKRDVEVEKHYQAMLAAQRQPKLRKELAQQRLLKTIQKKKISCIEPVTDIDLIANLPLDTPTTEQEILKVLRMKPPTPLFAPSDSLFEKGARSIDTVTEDEDFDKMPKVVALNLFEPNSATILPESYPLLHQYGKVLQNELQDVVLIIAAYTDDRGSEIYNLGLSKSRAEAIKQYFMTEFQIPEDRLKIKPYGKRKPIVPNETEEGRRLNNRIELIRIQ